MTDKDAFNLSNEKPLSSWGYSDNAIAIYKRLYFDKLKKEEKPSQVHSRIAKFIGEDPAEENKFYHILDAKIFRPNSPCMINAGSNSKNAHDRALSACYVLGLEDSMDSIIEMWGICAKIYASGAGAGIPITNLREKNAPISTGGVASGPLAYLNVVDMLSNTVRSGGKTRRAANMGVFKHDHPDVLNILDAKLNGSIQTFNLSMSVNDDFMSELNDDKHKNMLWKKAISNAWTNGDPGLFFHDTINRFNPFPSLGDVDCTNPCGEVPLPPWSVCNIGSINVAHFIEYGAFNWDEFERIIPTCFLFLDRVIDKQEYIHHKFHENAKDFRPVGLGIMGFADALIKMNMPYDSQEAIQFFEKLCFELNYHCIKKSIELAKDGGCSISIPGEDYKHFHDLIKYYLSKGVAIVDKKIDDLLKDFEQYGIRNSNWTMIAPTGSTSMSADCSYGWEPLMALVWEKPLVESDEVLKIVDPNFETDLIKWITENQHDSHVNAKTILERKEFIIADIIDNKGSIQNIDYLPTDMKAIYKVAHDIDPMFKIQMQGAGQKYISMAISSTTNLPNSATKETVADIYFSAWENGLKGITIFRDDCRDDQVVNFGKVKEEKVYVDNIKIDRPIKRDGSTVEIKTPHGKFFVTVNHNSGKPIEMFFSIGKQGGMVNVVIDALARICSKGLQAGMTMEWIVDTLEGLKGDTPFWFQIADNVEKRTQAESIVDALAKVLEYHFTNDHKEPPIKGKIWDDENIYASSVTEGGLSRCPECGKKGLAHSTGCRGGECLVCGFTNCS